MSSEPSLASTSEHMSDIYRLIDDYISEIPALYQTMKESTSQLLQLVSEGKGDIMLLADRSQADTRQYTALRERAVHLLQTAHDDFESEAAHARSCGIAFAEHPAEHWPAPQVEDYTPEKLVNDMLLLRQAHDSLVAAVAKFEGAQHEIQAALAELDNGIANLSRLGADVQDMRALYDHLARRQANVMEARDPLLIDVQEAVERSRASTQEYLCILVGSVMQSLHVAYERLGVLGASVREDNDRIESLSDQLEHPNEELLQFARELYAEFEKRIADRRSELGTLIHEQVTTAQQLRSSLDDSMEESLTLDTILSRFAVLDEANLLTYHQELTRHIAAARNAGVNALYRYEQTMLGGTEEVISEAEANLIGTAMVASAHVSEAYSGRLWRIGEDVLLRMLFADLDPQDFYDKFGYSTIARSIAAAISRQELLLALGVFGTGFLPPAVRDESDQLSSVLVHPEVQAAFAHGDALVRLTPQHVAGVDVHIIHGALVFLKHAHLVGFPVETSLQWTATLYSTLVVGHELHRRASYLLVQLLLESRRFLSLYYTLHALHVHYSDIWDQPLLRPIFKPLVEQALQLNADSNSFLGELCSHPGPCRLAVGDFSSEFLLASTAHYLIVKYQLTPLLSQAWGFWEQIAPEYPILSALLLKQLKNEAIDVDFIEQDVQDLHEQLIELKRKIEARLLPPQYVGVRLALLVHNYYAQQMESWLPYLFGDDTTRADLDQIGKAIDRLQQSPDLAEECPYQQTPPDPIRTPLYDPLKGKVNARLIELLDMCHAALDRKRKLMKLQSNGSQPQGNLADELARLASSSETVAWSLQILQAQVLPIAVPTQIASRK